MPDGLLCQVGAGLEAYWRQMHNIMKATGLDEMALRVSPPVRDALDQYREHKMGCPTCRAAQQEIILWARDRVAANEPYPVLAEEGS